MRMILLVCPKSNTLNRNNIMNFIDLAAQYQAYKHEIDGAIQQVLDSSHYIMGEAVVQLEKR